MRPAEAGDINDSTQAAQASEQGAGDKRDFIGSIFGDQAPRVQEHLGRAGEHLRGFHEAWREVLYPLAGAALGMAAEHLATRGGQQREMSLRGPIAGLFAGRALERRLQTGKWPFISTNVAAFEAWRTLNAGPLASLLLGLATRRGLNMFLSEKHRI